MQVLTREQIRAARAAIGWSGTDLAQAAEVSLRTITKLEVSPIMPDVRYSTLLRIKSSLEAQGIEFITAPDGSPGIVIRPQPIV